MSWVLVTHETINDQDVGHAYDFDDDLLGAWAAGERILQAARRAGSNLKFGVLRLEDRPRWS